MDDVSQTEVGAPELSVVLGPNRALGEPRLLPLSAESPARGSSSSSSAAGDAPEWVMVLPLGRSEDDPALIEVRDWRPDFRCPDPQRVVDEFNERVERDGPVVIDRNHAELYSWFNTETPAAGWLSQLDLRDDGIYGRSSWTPRGRREVVDLEYGYTSAVVSLIWQTTSEGDRDYETPPEVGRIVGLSLVNSPGSYTKWLAALRQEPHAFMAGFGLAPFDAGAAEQLRARASQLQAGAGRRSSVPVRQPSAAALSISSAAPAAQPVKEPMSSNSPTLPPAAAAALEHLGLPADATPEAVAAAFGRLSGPDNAPVVAQLIETVEQLQRSNTERQITDLIDGALASGRLTPGAVEVYRELGRTSGVEMLERTLGALAAAPLDRREGKVEVETPTGLAASGGGDFAAYAATWGLSAEQMDQAIACRGQLPEARLITEPGDFVRVGG